MKKLLAIISSISLFGVCILNSNIVENTKNILKNLSTKNDVDWSTADLSKFEINHIWNTANIQTNDININYQDFRNGPGENIKQNIYMCLAKNIDYKFKIIENKYFETNFLSNLANNSELYPLLKITILDQNLNNSSLQPLNNYNTAFTNFKINNNEIQSYNLRISNKSSMDWKTNKSYFNISVNICNFDTLNPVKIFSEKDLISMQTNKSARVWHSGNYNQSTPIKTFHVSDICPQFTNYDTAQFFLEPNRNLSYHFNMHVKVIYFNYPTEQDNRLDEVKNINLNNLEQIADVRKESSFNDGFEPDATTSFLKQFFIRGGAQTIGFNNVWNNYDKSDPQKIYIMGIARTHMWGREFLSYKYAMTYTGLELDANFNDDIFKNNPN